MRKVASVFAAIVGALLVAAILFPVFAKAKGGSNRMPVCVSRVKQLLASSAMYRSDNNDRLMLAPSWMDATTTYVKEPTLYNCIELENQGKKYGYAMNRFLSGVDLTAFKDPSEAHLIYESSLVEKNANEFLPTFPIPGRSRGINAIGFADGHARGIQMGERK